MLSLLEKFCLDTIFKREHKYKCYQRHIKFCLDIMTKDKKYLEMYLKYQEGYSLSEVGKMFGLTKGTVRVGFHNRGYVVRKNKIYVSIDGESYSSKFKRKLITLNEYKDEKAKRLGFKDNKEYEKDLIIRKGFKNITQYHNFLAVKRGFKNNVEYTKHWRHKKKINISMSENKDCNLYLGVHIAENALSKIFEDVQRMPYGNPKYDFICGRGFKIDVKSACQYIDRGRVVWSFHINCNTIADYFLCIAFDNRKHLNPLHIWLIGGDEIINKYKIKEYMKVGISDSIKILKKYSKYELDDKLCLLKEKIKDSGGNIENISS